MGLEKFTNDSSDDSNNSSSSRNRTGSSSSSSSTSDHPFPKYDRRVPTAVIKEYNGELQFFRSPDDRIQDVPFRKDWYSAPWEMDCGRPEEWEHVWWDASRLANDRYKVEKIYGVDLLEYAKERPERALEYRREANKKWQEEHGDRTPEQVRSRSCRVCDSRIDLRYGEYEKIEDAIVCPDHSVKELAEADLL